MSDKDTIKSIFERAEVEFEEHAYKHSTEISVNDDDASVDFVFDKAGRLISVTPNVN